MPCAQLTELHNLLKARYLSVNQRPSAATACHSSCLKSVPHGYSLAWSAGARGGEHALQPAGALTSRTPASQELRPPKNLRILAIRHSSSVIPMPEGIGPVCHLLFTPL